MIDIHRTLHPPFGRMGVVAGHNLRLQDWKRGEGDRWARLIHRAGYLSIALSDKGIEKKNHFVGYG